MNPNLYVYDIETYPNVFTCCVRRPSDSALWKFEISPWVHEGVQLFTFLSQLSSCGARMVGYNNVGFDYPVIHVLLEAGGNIYAQDLYNKAMAIIHGDSFEHTIWQPFIPQIDLYKIHHFDNKARRTSLKVLEFNMCSENIEDLPFKPGTELTYGDMPILKKYNLHDVDETVKFLYKSLDRLEFRDELTAKYGKDFTNHNDTKIGKDYFIMELKKRGVPTDRKTERPYIRLNECILPTITFDYQPFREILRHLQNQTITETKGVFKGLSATLNGFQYDFGTGGIHGSISKQVVKSDDHHIIIDLDVASYYPNLAIANNFYPEHLGQAFCHIYKDVYEQRKQYSKGSVENAMLKLALNGVYGDSNNPYSKAFYDPKYTMQITINGQLLLCKLAELLSNIPQLQMIQINTDGLTVRVPRSQSPVVDGIARIWEQLTGLELERADYNRMLIRDVNNYIAEYTDGKLKRKGAYCYGSDLDWHQNHSAQVIQKAAEAHMVRGESIERFIYSHPDMFDFMLRAKVPASSRLVGDHFTGEIPLQNTCRYYVAVRGYTLTKIMPPTANQLAANPQAPERRIKIGADYLASECNDVTKFNPANLNFQYYIDEAKKLVI